jgi:hypothetical protein
MSNNTKAKRKTTRRRKSGTARQPQNGVVNAADVRVSQQIEMVDPKELQPARVNGLVYNPVSRDDPAVVELAKDIRDKGQVLQTFVATLENVIVSGHRRQCAAILAGVKLVPVQRINITPDDPRFESVLVAFNQQRVKSIPEQIREEVIRTSPDDAYKALIHQRSQEEVKQFFRVWKSELRILDGGSARRRSVISEGKRAMLDAAIAVLEQYRDYWPLTLRQIHYRLLTRNVPRNTTPKKGQSIVIYDNSQEAYKDLSGLLTRARLTGEVRWESMHDPTRPRTRWRQYDSVAEYTREQLDAFLCGYKRNLLQSQSAYVELVVEKITAQEIAERAAGYFHVPVGVGRGYTSTTSLDETAERFRASGKEKMILLIAGDLDPEGEDASSYWDRCLRDEHGVEYLTTVKVAVNPDQVEQFNLPPLPMKESSSRAAGFKAAHGDEVYELEAFEPDQLQAIIRDAIQQVLDMELFAAEQTKEREDARHLVVCRNKALEMFKGYDFEGVAS